MTHRSTRLFIIKFVGLWSGFKTTDPKKDENESSSGSLRRLSHSNHEVISTSKADHGAHSKREFRPQVEALSRKVVGLMLEKGIPGLTVRVSIKKDTVWEAGFGFCDVENQVECVPEAHMRIASISKPLFAATIVGPMIEHNKINLKSSIHQYLTEEEFPKQNYQGKEYDITVEQLLSHTSGIKHYAEGPTIHDPLRPICSEGSTKVYQNDDQFNKRGFYQQRTYRNVMEALEPFRDGPLLYEPGQYRYTTYGYTLLSAVAQKVHQKDIKSESEQIEDFWVKTLHRDWGMNDTYLDHDENIISNRARYYLRSGLRGALINAPYANNSVKWAGGGVVSTTNDLIKFGNLLIDCYKERESAKLKRETIQLLWKEVTNSYALGFALTPLGSEHLDKTMIYHLGGALGASSALLIYPEAEIVVAILVNLGSVDLKPLAATIADEFAKLV